MPRWQHTPNLGGFINYCIIPTWSSFRIQQKSYTTTSKVVPKDFFVKTSFFTTFNTSTFLQPLNGPRNSFFGGPNGTIILKMVQSVFKLNLLGPNGTIPDLHLHQTQNLTLKRNFLVKNNKTEKKMRQSIPSTEILLMLTYQQLTTKIK